MAKMTWEGEIHAEKSDFPRCVDCTKGSGVNEFYNPVVVGWIEGEQSVHNISFLLETLYLLRGKKVRVTIETV